jgi:hypothetical protein
MGANKNARRLLLAGVLSIDLLKNQQTTRRVWAWWR